MHADDGWIYAPPTAPLVVLHQDRDLVVIDKPSGLLSVPGRDPARRDSALSRVLQQHPRAYTVHRLDLDTSGVLVLALRRKAEAALHSQFRDRSVAKTYVALVAGEVAEESGLIELPLSREQGRPRSRVDPQGKAASTAWQVLERLPGQTRLALTPHTGRSHQLRVHLLALGHPILGDRFYAPPAVVAAAPRLCLHAARLVLAHPYSGVRLELSCPVPF